MREITTTSKCEAKKKKSRNVLWKLAVMILMFVQLIEIQELRTSRDYNRTLRDVNS
jgi:hypothetical protein